MCIEKIMGDSSDLVSIKNSFGAAWVGSVCIPPGRSVWAAAIGYLWASSICFVVSLLHCDIKVVISILYLFFISIHLLADSSPLFIHLLLLYVVRHVWG